MSITPRHHQAFPAILPWLSVPCVAAFYAWVCSALLCVSLVSAASDTPTWLPSLSPSAAGSAHDLELTLKARKALFQNDALTGYSLGISVHNRAATLWGAVPSAELARHAEQTLRGVLGLASIRNDLQIEARREPEKTPVPPRGTKPLPLLPEKIAAEEPRSQGVLVRRPPGSGLAADPELRWRQPEGKSAGPVGNRSKPEADACEDDRASASNVDRACADLTKAVESLRLADQRFQRLSAHVKGATVSLSGSVYRWDHLHELARSISRLPGVRDVLFKDVEADLRD